MSPEAHWTDIIFETQTDPRLAHDWPDIVVADDLDFFRRVAETYTLQNHEWQDSETMDWSGLLIEATYVAMAETDACIRRKKLMRVAAVSIAWSNAIAARGQGDTP